MTYDDMITMMNGFVMEICIYNAMGKEIVKDPIDLLPRLMILNH